MQVHLSPMMAFPPEQRRDSEQGLCPWGLVAVRSQLATSVLAEFQGPQVAVVRVGGDGGWRLTGGLVSAAVMGEAEPWHGNCIAHTSPWSPCSTSCGLGISTRVSNANTRCWPEQESRLCALRPCGMDIRPLIKVRPLPGRAGQASWAPQGTGLPAWLPSFLRGLL